MTPTEIEPATFRLVAQCLNQLRLRVPPKYVYLNYLLLYALIKLCCKFPEDGDSAETCRS